MSSIVGYPDWGSSYVAPLDPTRAVTFTANKADGTNSSAVVYGIPAGKTIILAAANLCVSVGGAGPNIVPEAALQVSAGLDGASAATTILYIAHNARSDDANIHPSPSAAVVSLGAAIGIMGGAAGNSLQFAWNLDTVDYTMAVTNGVVYTLN